MKVKSCYTVYGFNDINVALRIFVDFYGCKIIHHPEIPGLQYYVVIDENGNRTDLVSGNNVKDDDHWMRVNVDNLDEALATFTKLGAELKGEIIESNAAKLAFVVTGVSKLNQTILFEHKNDK